MAYKNIYESNTNVDYPNYPFPYEYTKSGQQKMKDIYTSDSHTDSIQTQNLSPQNNTYTQQPNQMNLSALLPLIKAISNKGKISTSDMMKTFMPMMSENTKNLGEIISAFDQINKNTTHVSKIESYTRVDE